MTIINHGAPITGWSLVWSFPADQTIVTMWNATPSQTGTSVTAKDAGWNASIPAGGTVSFVLNGVACSQ